MRMRHFVCALILWAAAQLVASAWSGAYGTAMAGGGDLCRGDMELGTRTTNQIPFEGESCWYSFYGEADQVANIALRRLAPEGNLDPFLEVRSPSGQSVVNDDASGSTLDSRVQGYTLPESGWYTIRAGAYQDASAGPFELTLWRGDQCGGTKGSMNWSEYAQNSAAWPHCDYWFRGTQDRDVIIKVEVLEGNLRPLIQLTDADNYIIASSTTGELRYYLDRGTGWYGIRVTSSVSPRSYGLFKITVSEPVRYPVGLASCRLITVDPAGLAAGKQMFDEYTLPSGASCQFRLAASAGNVITVRMQRKSTDLDPYLVLLNPDGNQEAFCDDIADGDYNSLIREHTLERTGTYTIVAESYRRQTSGRFYLSVWMR